MRIHYAVCIKNHDYKRSLVVRKIYQVIPFGSQTPGLLKVIDETNKGYLYPEEYFMIIPLPLSVQRKLFGNY